MSMTEIDKLREKVEKDPNSRLYVPLAEEYRKEGKMDEAIEVLHKGLERHPGYMSARVSLGKIYYAKGQMDEARAEFETVIKSIPDNLYAHKKLAEIYRDTGEKDLAINAFKTVLKLNPMDEETLQNLQDLEKEFKDKPPEKLQEPGGTSKEGTPLEAMVLEQTTHEPAGVEEMMAEEVTEQPEESLEDMDAFKQSLFGEKTEAAEESSDDIFAVEEEVSAGAEERPAEAELTWSIGEVFEKEGVPEIEGLAEGPEGKWSFADLETSTGIEAVKEEVGTEEATAEEAGAEEANEEALEISEEADEELSFVDMSDVFETEGLAAVAETEKITEDTSATHRDESLAELTEESTSAAASENQNDKGLLLQRADSFISEEKYLEAINVYQQALAADAGDKQILQRVEELRFLLRLMGKDKELLIAKLNAFLGAIKKRGDEFSGSS